VRYGATFSIVVGIVLLIVAALAPFVPWLLPGLHAPATPMM
jgi:hypothetical protein